MSFRDFSKNLSNEIENLFANLGDSNLPEEAHRLDKNLEQARLDAAVDIQQIWERVKALDVGEKK